MSVVLFCYILDVMLCVKKKKNVDKNESNVNPLHLQRLRCWELMTTGIFLLHDPTTKHLNRLIGDILVFPCTGVDTMADSSQLTQGGFKVRRSCQSTIVGAACTELRHSDRNLRTA